MAGWTTSLLIIDKLLGRISCAGSSLRLSVSSLCLHFIRLLLHGSHATLKVLPFDIDRGFFATSSSWSVELGTETGGVVARSGISRIAG